MDSCGPVTVILVYGHVQCWGLVSSSLLHCFQLFVVSRGRLLLVFVVFSVVTVELESVPARNVATVCSERGVCGLDCGQLYVTPLSPSSFCHITKQR